MLNKLFGRHSSILPEKPARFPERGAVEQWMHQKVAYVNHTTPDHLSDLFNPSSGDYLPLAIVAGIGPQAMNDHLEAYRALKDKFPEAVQKARSQFLDYAFYRGGPSEDYPST